MGWIEYIAEVVAHLFFLSSILLSAGGTGYILLRKQRFHSFLEKVIFSISLGLGLWALLLFVLGLLGWLYRDLIWSLTIACALGVILYILRSKNLMLEIQRWRRNYKPHLQQIIPIIAIFYLGILLSVTLYPPVLWDATMYHLVLARQYLIDHHITVNTGLTFPVLPALNHMLFTWTFALKDHLLAQMIECTFLILTAIGLYSWGKRENRPAFGLAVGAFWLAHPIVLLLGRNAYVEIGLVAFLFLGIYALRIFWNHHDAHWWYVAVALLSFASAIKMLGLPFLAIGTAAGVYAYSKQWIHWKSLACGYTLAFFLVIPWYALIAGHTGNPFWPLFYQYSNGVWSSPSISNTFEWIFKVGIPKTPLNFVLVPYEMIVNPMPFQPVENQTLFFPIIAWPLALIISLFSRSVRWWALWTLFYTAFWFLSSQQLRFWIVILPIASLALFESAKWLVERLIGSLVIQNAIWLTLAFVAFLFSANTTVSLIRAWGFPSVTEQRQQQFLKNGFLGYKAVEYINQKSTKNDVVYVIHGSWLNYYFQPRVIDMTGILQGSQRPEFHWPEDRKWIEHLKSQNVTWIMMNHVLVPPSIKLKKAHATDYPCWPEYRLAYSDHHSWVFHYSPSPADANLDSCEPQRE